MPDATAPSGAGAVVRALPALQDEPGGPRGARDDALGSPDDLAHAVLDGIGVGIVACDADGSLVLFNEAARRLHGRPCDPSLRPDQWAAGYALLRADGCTPLPPDEVPLRRVLRDGSVRDTEIVIAPPDQAAVIVQCTGTVLRDVAGQVTGAVVALTDVTALRASEQRLRAAHEATARSEVQFRHAFERGPTPMCRLDADGVVQQLNPALRRLVARPTSSVLGRRLVSLVAPADREQVEVCLAAAGSPELDVDSVEVRLRRPDESLVWCELAVSTSTDDHGAPMLLVQLADVDARRRREEELERRASQDALTGLPNRAALLHVLAERLAPAAGQRAPSLLFLDLDAFKQVNDDGGHGIGDQVLVEVARRLQDAVRPDDLVARLGGDEFVVVFDAGPHAAQVEQDLVARVQEALRPPVMTTAGARVVSASVGSGRAAIGEDPVAVLARADSAMYVRKRQRGRQDPRSRRPGRNPVLQPRIAELLATAEQEDRLDLVYQPVVDLETGRTVGAEALLRMRSRSGGVIGPDAFIPVAEATGDIHALGAWVLQRACEQAAQWKAALPPGAEFGMGVNLSPRQLDDPRLLDRIDAALESSGLHPGALVIELTERLLTADTDEVRRTLSGVRARGVHLACDDFGSGYASLRYLDELPIDLIKIDRSWTALLAGEGPSSRLALGVLRLAQTSGLIVVAEGVETELERDALRAEGCRLAQGYLFSRPDSAARLSEALGLPLPRQRTGSPSAGSPSAGSPSAGSPSAGSPAAGPADSGSALTR